MRGGERGALRSGFSALTKKPASLRVLLLPREDTEAGGCGSGRRLSRPGTLMVELQPPEPWEGRFCLISHVS